MEWLTYLNLKSVKFIFYSLPLLLRNIVGSLSPSIGLKGSGQPWKSNVVLGRSGGLLIYSCRIDWAKVNFVSKGATTFYLLRLLAGFFLNFGAIYDLKSIEASLDFCNFTFRFSKCSSSRSSSKSNFSGSSG